jgi:hypothetical protein
MSILPEWPAYEVGPPDSTFAIGVASIKYAQLEYALSSIFQYVMDISHDETQRLFAKMRNIELILPTSTQCISQKKRAKDWKPSFLAFGLVLKIEIC